MEPPRRAMARPLAGRVARRTRRLLAGLDPLRTMRRIAALERRVAELERRLARLDTPERATSTRLPRENALAIEHLLYEGVRLRRDVDAWRDGH